MMSVKFVNYWLQTWAPTIYDIHTFTKACLLLGGSNFRILPSMSFQQGFIFISMLRTESSSIFHEYPNWGRAVWR